MLDVRQTHAPAGGSGRLNAPHRYSNNARLARMVICLCPVALAAAQAAPPGNNYVDAGICAGCHNQIAQNHLQTGMGRSLFRPTSANTVEDYSNNKFYHPLSDTH